jgi:hypothetical protein
MIDLTKHIPDEVLHEHANTFRELVRSPGWALLKALIAAHSDKTAHHGHFDDEQPKGFYRGYLVACVDVIEAPESIVAESDKRNAAVLKDVERAERLRLRLPLAPEDREPEDDASRILRPKVWAGDEEAYL